MKRKDPYEGYHQWFGRGPLGEKHFCVYELHDKPGVWVWQEFDRYDEAIGITSEHFSSPKEAYHDARKRDSD